MWYCLRVERSLRDTQEKSSKEQTNKILGDTRESRHNRPKSHRRSHVIRRANASDQHVGGNATKDIANEKDRDTGGVLCRADLEIFFDIVEFGEGNGISVKVIEPVHEPKNGLWGCVRRPVWCSRKDMCVP